MQLKNYKLSTIGTCVTIIIGKAIGIGLSCSQDLPIGARIGIICATAVCSVIASILVSVVLTFYNKHKINKLYTTLTEAKQAKLEDIPLDVIDTSQKDKLSDKSEDKGEDKSEESQKTSDVDKPDMGKDDDIVSTFKGSIPEPASKDQELLGEQVARGQTADIPVSKDEKLSTESNIDGDNNSVNISTSGLNATHEDQKLSSEQTVKQQIVGIPISKDKKLSAESNDGHNDVADASISGIVQQTSDGQKLSDHTTDQQQVKNIISTPVSATKTVQEEKSIKSLADAASILMRKQRKILHVQSDGTYNTYTSEVQMRESDKISKDSKKSHDKADEPDVKNKLKEPESPSIELDEQMLNSNVGRLQMSRASKKSQGRYA
ncbi:hypothetical protein FDZ58_01990 [Ehrlichia ruminantium]|uniref:hypothetical protein n=1 Tax=Ehrlichia ruminantium TaxID=779 RepID=UPI0007A0A8CA|nr:hypothetical protein [Ehrlichia ruminantium]KYX00152.1 hypothetical protein AUR40_04425 [Ehrlichia ruminantium]QLK50432.1 hypothetical protein FDZ68_01980 [Ehrlichia ruminantium]QLK51357.1 hypothetical protein FDZ66_01985 [Ehrlichia ruminantium]QLK53192.1 hypothetical protein FDZ64_01985 [Ehrlichia ruminantium]QLK58694.1 hypothetical protein FDZ58_01990 [Ehrlichia ruminantium]